MTDWHNSSIMRNRVREQMVMNSLIPSVADKKTAIGRMKKLAIGNTLRIIDNRGNQHPQSNKQLISHDW